MSKKEAIATAEKKSLQPDKFNMMLVESFQQPIAEAIKNNVNAICMQNTFKIDGVDLTWKRINRKVQKQLNKYLENTDILYPENVTEEDDKADYMQREYLKLCYDGMTDEVYENMDLGAIEVLMRAPFVRQRGLFRQG